LVELSGIILYVSFTISDSFAQAPLSCWKKMLFLFVDFIEIYICVCVCI